MHQLQISLHQWRFLSIILSQVPAVAVANDGVACGEALRSQTDKPRFFRTQHGVTHLVFRNSFPDEKHRVAHFSLEEKSEERAFTPQVPQQGTCTFKQLRAT